MVPSPGPGNVVLIEVECENIHYIAAAFGTRRISRRQVANSAVKEAKNYIETEAPVCEYLADQLLIPMALAGGGKFRTFKPSLHTETNITVIKQFLDINITVKPVENNIWEIEIGE